MMNFLNKVIWPEKPKSDAEFVEALRSKPGWLMLLVDVFLLLATCLIMAGALFWYAYFVYEILEATSLFDELDASAALIFKGCVWVGTVLGATAGWYAGVMFIGIVLRRSNIRKWRPYKLLFKYYDLAKENGLLEELEEEETS